LSWSKSQRGKRRRKAKEEGGGTQKIENREVGRGVVAGRGGGAWGHIWPDLI
jgi:hypothetical protein